MGEIDNLINIVKSFTDLFKKQTESDLRNSLAMEELIQEIKKLQKAVYRLENNSKAAQEAQIIADKDIKISKMTAIQTLMKEIIVIIGTVVTAFLVYFLNTNSNRPSENIPVKVERSK